MKKLLCIYPILKVTKSVPRGSYMINSFSDEIDIDSSIFYSVPTSYFVIDKRIPKIIRDLITEADGSLKMNFLTGSSACMRKAIYGAFNFRKNYRRPL